MAPPSGEPLRPPPGRLPPRGRKPHARCAFRHRVCSLGGRPDAAGARNPRPSAVVPGCTTRAMSGPSHFAEELDRVLQPATRDFYLRALKLVRESGVPFLLGGAYAFGTYTGILRHTKDLD